MDVLRALAIFLVSGRHIKVLPSSIVGQFLSSVSFFWNRGGWIGVDLFFVLSGFLISGLLFREYQQTGEISFKRFFIRRGFKIYPAFYTFIFLMLIFKLRPPPFSAKEVWVELLFLQNYSLGLFGHTWSLAVEEHFYLILPLLLIFLSRNKKVGEPFRGIPGIFLIIAALCFLFRVFTCLNIRTYSYYTHFFPTHLRADALFFGVLISYFYHFARVQYDQVQKKYGHLFLWLGLIFLMPAFLFPLSENFFVMTAGLSLFYLGSGMILMAFLEREKSFCGRTASVLAFIGSRSYSIYIWHTYAIHLSERVLTYSSNWFIYTVLCVMAPVLMGILMAWLVEYPMLRLRGKYFPNAKGIETVEWYRLPKSQV